MSLPGYLLQELLDLDEFKMGRGVGVGMMELVSL